MPRLGNRSSRRTCSRFGSRPPSSARHSTSCFFFFNDTATTEIYTLSLHDALPILTDTGIGIRKDMIPCIFQRFWQGEQRGNELNAGLGLGLALARHFTELHGGTITAASDGPGHGTTFTVTLPLASRNTSRATA